MAIARLMVKIVSALAVTLAVNAAPPPAGPIEVAFQTRDGKDIRGTIQKWDEQSFSGTFGQIKWGDVPAVQAWHIVGRLIDVNDAAHWLRAGRVMKQVPGGEAAARNAFQWARWVGGRALAEANNQLAELEKSPIPEWPVCTQRDLGRVAGAVVLNVQPKVNSWLIPTVERPTIVEDLKRKTRKTLEAIQLPLQAYENDWFVLFTDAPPEEARAWLDGLDSVYQNLALTFGTRREINIFWGKAVIVMCQEYADFARFNRTAFKSTTVPEMGGLTTRIGPEVVVTLWMMPDKLLLGHTLGHEVTHAFLHRLWTSARFPLWFEEGLCDYAAAIVSANSPIDELHWETVRDFVITGGPVNAVLDMGCEDDGWPGPRQVGYGVGYYLVRTMFETDPLAAMKFIKSVKVGKDWPKALAEDFGKDRKELVDLFINLIKSAPAAPPAPPRPPGDLNPLPAPGESTVLPKSTQP